LARLIGRGQPANAALAPLPGHAHVIGLGLLMALCTFLVRIVQPMGTNILNMQLCYFSQYILLFSVGLLAWRRNWLLRIPYAFGMKWFTLALTVGVAGWFAIAIPVFQAHAVAQLSGGVTWQSAAFSLWESFFCLGVCLGLTVWFREKFNRQGRLTQWLSDNCFAVYMSHPPVLIAVTLALQGWAAPKPLKFLTATVLGVVLTYLASSLVLRRIPLLRRVL
jgi:surface polysaccharide O-acyltransferase-like enzyme